MPFPLLWLPPSWCPSWCQPTRSCDAADSQQREAFVLHPFPRVTKLALGSPRTSGCCCPELARSCCHRRHRGRLELLHLGLHILLGCHRRCEGDRCHLSLQEQCKLCHNVLVSFDIQAKLMSPPLDSERHLRFLRKDMTMESKACILAVLDQEASLPALLPSRCSCSKSSVSRPHQSR